MMPRSNGGPRPNQWVTNDVPFAYPKSERLHTWSPPDGMVQIEPLERRRLDTMSQDIRSLKEEVRSLKEEVRSKKDDLRKAKKELKLVTGERRHAIRDAEDLKLYLEEANRRVKQVENDNEHLKEEITRQRLGNENLKEQTRRIEANHADARRVYDTRMLELKYAQKFLSLEDSWSGADVTAMVEKLNSEIMHTAAMMTDSLKFGVWLAGTKEKREVKDACARASGILGEKMIDHLRFTQEEEPELVQPALQYCMILHCNEMLEAWDLNNRKSGQVLADIYKQIQETEHQAISGRWRTITRRASIGCSPEEHLPHDFLDTLVDIFTAAGWSGHGHGSKAREVIQEKFGDGLMAIGKLAANLNKAIGEEITSGDMSAIIVRPNARFDPSEMNDENADRSAGRRPSKSMIGERVLCTSSMGLRKITRGSDGVGKYGPHEVKVLLKPKVHLCSVLMVDGGKSPEPQGSTGRRSRTGSHSQWGSIAARYYQV